ncbi:hypothetical protein G7Y79_00003g010990 [Physcia stellaris]|nr:hypothetical protein G7Y79_00003g010990 [Physcia stellaris]
MSYANQEEADAAIDHSRHQNNEIFVYEKVINRPYSVGEQLFLYHAVYLRHLEGAELESTWQDFAGHKGWSATHNVALALLAVARYIHAMTAPGKRDGVHFQRLKGNAWAMAHHRWNSAEEKWLFPG